jgi:hypothetical protein
MDFESAFRQNNFGDTANAHYWDTVKRTGHSYPEQDLVLAVLKDALLNYRKQLRNPKKSLRRDRRVVFLKRPGRIFFFRVGVRGARIRSSEDTQTSAPLGKGSGNPTERGSTAKLRPLVYFVAGGDWSNVASFRRSSGFKSDTTQ